LSLLLLQGLHPKVVSKRLGHGSIMILQLLCKGLTVPEIAAARRRSRKMIWNTVSDLYRAFNVRNRTELLNELLHREIIKTA
jgi:DNA-binding NarL/FixJ family response regulator